MDGKELSLEMSILTLLATSIRADKKALSLIQGENQYLWNTISRLKTRGLINVSKDPWWHCKLSKYGAERIAQYDDRLYDFYMKYSNNGAPGGNVTHKRSQCKAAQVIAMVRRANVMVASDKPSRAEIAKDPRLKLSNSDSSFYFMKEFKHDNGQKKGRSEISRATGALFSDGINALIYNTQGDIMKLTKGAERSANFYAVDLRYDVYSEEPNESRRRSIILGNDLEVATSIMCPDSELQKQLKRIPLSYVISDRNFSDRDFIFVPMDDFGVMVLKLLTRYSEDEIKKIVFKDDEIEKGKSKRDCDAYVNGLKCFEFLTMNLSKLRRVISLYGSELDKIGFVCYNENVDFLESVCNKKINKRVVRSEYLCSHFLR